jgi:hypothetical protein
MTRQGLSVDVKEILNCSLRLHLLAVENTMDFIMSILALRRVCKHVFAEPNYRVPYAQRNIPCSWVVGSFFPSSMFKVRGSAVSLEEGWSPLHACCFNLKASPITYATVGSNVYFVHTIHNAG